MVVSTRPASISELLGQAWADIKSAVDPHNIQITPQLRDLKASYVPNPNGASGGASAALELDVNDSVPCPAAPQARCPARSNSTRVSTSPTRAD